MPQRNPRFGVPTLPGASGMVIRRGPFLDGSLQAYYGPGQPPDAGQEGHYKPPTDWPAAGTVLRRPQVAQLELHVPLVYEDGGLFKIDVNVGVPLAYYGPGISVGSDVGGVDYNFTQLHCGNDGGFSFVCEAPAEGFPPPPGSIPWTSTTTTGQTTFTYNTGGGTDPGLSYHSSLFNPFPGESARLRAAFLGAKAAVEALRSGRTFVNVVDPWVDVPTPGGALPYSDRYFKDVPDPTGYWSPSDTHPYFLYLAPQVRDGDAFLGVNQLRAYAGSPNTVKEQIWYPRASTDAATYLDNAVAASIGAIAHNAPLFCAYALRVYSTDLPLGRHPPYEQSYTPLGVPPTIQITTGGADAGTWLAPQGTPPITGSDTYYWIPQDNSSFLAGLITSIGGQIANVNLVLSLAQDLMRQRLVADLLTLQKKQVDGQWVGTTGPIDVRPLVELIAAFYHFDPDTGDDLPPGG